MNRPAAGRGLRPHELRRALGKQAPGPIYFCLGEEPYVTAQAIELLRDAAVGPEDLLNTERFEAGAPMMSILTAAAMLPAFAERRLVVLTSAESLTADDQELLTAYINDPSPSTCFVVAAAKADQRRRLFSLLLQRATVVNCQPLLERELPSWLNGQATAMGLQLTPDVAHALIERTGASLHALTNELEKLRTYGSARAEALAQTGGDAPLPLKPPSQTHVSSTSVPVKIELDALTQLTAHGREHSIFELTDAVGERRLADALVLARHLLDQGEHPVGLLTMLTRHLRRLWLARCAADAGQAPAALAQRLGVMPRYAETLHRQSAGFTSRRLQRILTSCVTADAQLKGGRLPKEQVVELLLLEVCREWPGPLMATYRI